MCRPKKYDEKDTILNIREGCWYQYRTSGKNSVYIAFVACATKAMETENATKAMETEFFPPPQLSPPSHLPVPTVVQDRVHVQDPVRDYRPPCSTQFMSKITELSLHISTTVRAYPGTSVSPYSAFVPDRKHAQKQRPKLKF